MADSTSITGLGGISGDLPRQGNGRQPPTRTRPSSALERKPGTQETVPETADPPTQDPTTALIQALDRLRVTNELRPAEAELARALRGARYYQEESRHDLPVLEDLAPPAEGLPPDQSA